MVQGGDHPRVSPLRMLIQVSGGRLLQTNGLPPESLQTYQRAPTLP
jgi:hypothetical protein